ncbi:MAG: hypothetical protein IIZ67_06795 [Bacilli bacterium]|jgi:hypothetical protein|nr:hypothetical protein [Bacilli bacterium]
MDEYISKVASNLDLSNNLQNINGFLLTTKECQVLDQFGIDYKNCTSLKEVLFEVEEVLEEQYDDQLEDVSISISDRDYYQNSNK